MIKYIFLGIIQGLTEFLPVSSSAHLVIFQKLLGMRGGEIAITVVLHLGTCLALIIFFFKDIVKLFRDRKSLLLVFIVTLITGSIGLAGKEFFERLFSSTKPVAVALIITGAILLFTKKFMEEKRIVLNIKDAVMLGFTQAVAIIPGISRSGITVSTLLFRKIDREICFKFSFLASIPAVIGAAILEASKIDSVVKSNFNNLAAGFIFSLLIGIIALWIVKFAIKKEKFHYFGYYCIIAGIITLLFI